jgi:hypothetical protein
MNYSKFYVWLGFTKIRIFMHNQYALHAISNVSIACQIVDCCDGTQSNIENLNILRRILRTARNH